VPPAGRNLRGEYAAALRGWEWDVALLQEVPPWWPAALASATGSAAFDVLTSRNALLPLRRAVAERWPDVIKSNGGGADAILVRGMEADAHRDILLRRVPERRRMHAVRIPGQGWVGNLHAQGSQAEATRAADALQGWAGSGEPLVLGGDFNLAAPELPGVRRMGGHGVDLVFARGWEAEAAEVLEHGRLSDHAPVRVRLGASRSA
jgi:endonuclease/exonuclease/phosphatase family metal-dependent hydrolase